MVTAVLAAVAPERAPVTSDVSVTLASIGDQAFAETTIAIASALGVLAWLLPVLALVCFVAAIALSPNALADRRDGRTSADVGGAAPSASLLVVGGFIVHRLDDDTLGGAVAQAAWDVMVRPMRWGVALLAAFGLATMLACDSAAPMVLARHAVRVRDGCAATGEHGRRRRARRRSPCVSASPRSPIRSA